MNYIWSIMIIFSFIAAAVNGCVEETATAVFDGASAGITTALALAGAMAFWTGLLNVAEKSGVSEKFRKLLSPLIKKLFPRTSEKSRKYISMNLTANLLGMGNAATPMGIKAMHSLDGENKKPLYVSYAMTLFLVLNTTSFQLVPSTVIALRSAALSKNPFGIIIPVWIASAAAVVSVVIAVKLVFGRNE